METLAHSLHLHPMLVHFPIALFLGALVFETVGILIKKEHFHPTAVYLYIAATFLSPLAVQTGLWEQSHLQLHHPLVETHETLGLITMWTALVSLPILWWIKKNKNGIFRKVFFIFTFIVVVTVSAGAYFGGKMVYEYGIGIDSE